MSETDGCAGLGAERTGFGDFKSLLFSLFLLPAGASQVKWNKKNPNLLASSHDGDVRVWDKRVSFLDETAFGWCF